MIKIMLILSMVLMGCGSEQAKEGAIGLAGVTGSTGATGAAGAAGDDASVSTIRRCNKTVSGISYDYAVVTHSSGDVSVTCSIYDTFAAYERSFMYKSTMTGATTGYCALTYDIDAGSGGYFTFSSTQVKYNDVGSASNGNTITWATGECNTY